MRKRCFAALFVMLVPGAHAQWLNYPAPGTPRTRDGKPNLSARTPRASKGKPDLSGVWHVQANAASRNVALQGAVSQYTTNILADFKPEEVSERPEAAKVRLQRMQSGVRDNPSVHCLPHGIPLNNLLVEVIEVIKVIQTPGLIVIIYETDGTYRQIYTDGRELPEDPQPAWLGYSVGHWEGDTLVVSTAGFNDKSWLDLSGHSHSEALRLTERYHRRDFGHMDVEMTFDDPKMYTKPFTIKFTHLLQADSDILESYCNENEKDRVHLGIQ